MLTPGPRGKIPMGRMTPARGSPAGPEHHPWWFHPFRSWVRRPPAYFMRQLWRFDPELDCTWHPLEEKWGIWIRNPRIQNPICQGWGLLFTVAPDRLDDRVFARLYAASCRRWRDGKQYFDAIEREMARDREKREQQYTQDTVDAAMPFFDHSKIKISMCGTSNGSKFADYHS